MLKSCWRLASQLMLTVAAVMASPASASASPQKPNLPWDWTGIIGTGQSLSIGAQGRPVLSTSQPYHNLKLSTDDLPWPVDPANPAIALVPLVEPVGRSAPAFPSAWPENINGETPHAAMANEMTALVQAKWNRDFVSVHSAVGEDGQGMVFLKKDAVPKGVNGRSYAAALIVTKATTRLARAAGQSYGVGAIIVTHGESDAGNPKYEEQLYKLWRDYDKDLRAITGQKPDILMIVSQQNSCADRSPSTLAQWRIGVDHAEHIVCSGPKYQYPYVSDGVHLVANGYRQLGEKYGQIYFERSLLQQDWRPLEPTAVDRAGRTITIHFHVPVPPLAWDTRLETPHLSVPEWKSGRGFEVSTGDGQKVAIVAAAISGDAVVVTCASDPGPGARIGYAMYGEKVRMSTPFPGTFRWGQLCDSDPFTGAVTGIAQPNYCVAFELAAK